MLLCMEMEEILTYSLVMDIWHGSYNTTCDVHLLYWSACVGLSQMMVPVVGTLLVMGNLGVGFNLVQFQVLQDFGK